MSGVGGGGAGGSDVTFSALIWPFRLRGILLLCWDVMCGWRHLLNQHVRLQKRLSGPTTPRKPHACVETAH